MLLPVTKRIKIRDGVAAGFKGVCWAKTQRRWKIAIVHQGKTINLGFRLSEDEAAHLYDRAARLLRGDQAHTAAGVAAKHSGKRVRGKYVQAHYLNFPTNEEEMAAQSEALKT